MLALCLSKKSKTLQFELMAVTVLVSDLIHTCTSKEKQENANLEQVQLTVLTSSFIQQRQLV